jgi:hypothetical protein
VTKSRNTTGAPSVTKYAEPDTPRSAARTRPWTALSTWQVDVRCRPPPIHRKRPDSTSATIAGTSVVSPGPQTNRGRTTTVSIPAAPTTAASASAFVAEYGARECSASGVRSSASTSRWPCSSAASVPTCTNLRTPASREARSTARVPSTLTRRNSSHAPHSSTLAAAWKTTSLPRAPIDRAPSFSSEPRTGSAPRDSTCAAAASVRASARTVQPSWTRRSISRPPTNPDPPVTNATLT